MFRRFFLLFSLLIFTASAFAATVELDRSVDGHSISGDRIEADLASSGDPVTAPVADLPQDSDEEDGSTDDPEVPKHRHGKRHAHRLGHGSGPHFQIVWWNGGSDEAGGAAHLFGGELHFARLLHAFPPATFLAAPERPPKSLV